MSETNGDLTYSWLAARKPPAPTKVTVKAWGKTVWIRKLSAGEYERIAVGAKDNERRFAALAHAMCDQDGAAFFSEGYMLKTDYAINFLAKQDRDAIEELWEAFAKVNGLTPIEDLGKNSTPTESGNSASN